MGAYYRHTTPERDRASEGSAMMSATAAIPGRTSMGGQTRTIPRMHDQVGFAECRSSR